MTVDRESVLQAIRELYAEEDRWYFAKDVAVRMGLKGSGPIARVVRKELEAMAKEGTIDTEAESGFGRRFKAREGPPAEAVEEQEDEPEQEPRRRGGRAPVAVRRLLAALYDRPRRMVVLKDEGVDPKTVRRCVVDGWVEDAGADGYAITQAGRERLAEIDEVYPELARPETIEPQPIEPQPTEAKAEVEAEVEEPAPVPIPEPESKSEPEPKSEPKSEPEPEPDIMNPLSKLAGIPEDEPDEPPIGEAVNAVVVGVETVCRLTVRTATGRATVDVPLREEGALTSILGRMGTLYDAEGRAVRLREREGRTQVGHIVDDAWRWAL